MSCWIYSPPAGRIFSADFIPFIDLNSGNFRVILNHPIAIGFFVVAVGSIVFSLINQRKINRREAQAKDAATASGEAEQ